MQHHLLETFDSYLNLLRTKLRPQPTNETTIQFTLVKNKHLELRRLVDEAEATPEFSELAKESLLAIRANDEVPPSLESRAVEIGHFFRRSRCYMSIYDGGLVNGAALFEQFLAQSQGAKITRRYLLPLRSFGFFEDTIHFRDFSIRRFSVEELEDILQSDVREIFYDWTSLNPREIEGYWFIDLWRKEPARKVVTFYVGQPVTTSFKEDFDAFSRFSPALEPLLLYDWNSVDGAFFSRGERLDVPFILKVSSSMRGAPDVPPNVPPFQVGIVEQGEAVSPPDYNVYIEGEELRNFQLAVDHCSALIHRIREAECGWDFINVALVFYRQASLSPAGFLQLLWLMVSVDSLLGDSRDGSSGLKRRLSLLHGKAESERTEIREFVRKIYNLRSSIVHGRVELLSFGVRDDDLFKLHEIARRTIVWFLHYLNHVLDERHHKINGSLLSRDDLLNALDNDPSNQSARRLRAVLPQDFPYTPSWFDPGVSENRQR